MVTQHSKAELTREAGTGFVQGLCMLGQVDARSVQEPHGLLIINSDAF